MFQIKCAVQGLEVNHFISKELTAIALSLFRCMRNKNIGPHVWNLLDNFD